MAPPPESEDKAERRRKKKSFYAKLKKQEEDKMAELAEKYRDRAKERREGANPDYQVEDPLTGASGYRAVAPDLKSGDLCDYLQKYPKPKPKDVLIQHITRKKLFFTRILLRMLQKISKVFQIFFLQLQLLCGLGIMI